MISIRKNLVNIQATAMLVNNVHHVSPLGSNNNTWTANRMPHLQEFLLRAWLNDQRQMVVPTGIPKSYSFSGSQRYIVVDL
jgi:hypothetical protein